MSSATSNTYRLHDSAAADLDPATLYRILRLRVDVFVVEQACPYPELDGRDLEPTTHHWWFTESTSASDEVDGMGSPVAATLRVMQDGLGPDGRPEFRIGRVCTERAHRGMGLTAQLLTAALEDIGEHVCRIEAQTYLRQMYAKFGFRVNSDEYLEDGIPHVSMVRDGARPAETDMS
ncbi:GNAT family N-acetyltransferase [Gordonia sp. NPDC003504]